MNFIDNILTDAFFRDRCRLKGAEPQIDPADLCFRNTYDTPMSQMRVISEIVLVIWSVLYLVKAAREATFLERKVYIQSMALCPSRVVFLLGCAVMVLNVPLRLACKPKEEDTLAITVMLCTGPYFLFFCRFEKKPSHSPHPQNTCIDIFVGVSS